MCKVNPGDYKNGHVAVMTYEALCQVTTATCFAMIQSLHKCIYSVTK